MVFGSTTPNVAVLEVRGELHALEWETIQSTVPLATVGEVILNVSVVAPDTTRSPIAPSVTTAPSSLH